MDMLAVPAHPTRKEGGGTVGVVQTLRQRRYVSGWQAFGTVVGVANRSCDPSLELPANVPGVCDDKGHHRYAAGIPFAHSGASRWPPEEIVLCFPWLCRTASPGGERA